MSTQEQVYSNFFFYCFHYANSISPTTLEYFVTDQFSATSDSTGTNVTITRWNHISPQPTLELLMLITYDNAIAWKYFYDRKLEYPSIEDQLDMIFHDIIGGTGLENGDWVDTILSIKNKYPKPT